MGSEHKSQFQQNTTDSLFEEGVNCVAISKADRLGVITHGKDYFKTLYDAFHSAKKRIFILAWDIDSQVELIRGKEAAKHPRRKLGEVLDECCRNNPELQVYIIDWDYTQLFAHAREILPRVKFRLETSERVHFRLHKSPVAGGSHHQKIVLIDNQCAFCGGIDITKARWDTSEHQAEDPRRTDNSGEPQRPFHDMAYAMQGEVVAELEKLALSHWQDATGESLPPLRKLESTNQSHDAPEHSFWPGNTRAEFQNIPLAISRTVTSQNPDEQQFEAEKLFVDMIRSCKDYLYIENQYFTSQKVSETLEEVLHKENPPEIVVILTPYSDGWLAQQTMDVKRSKMIRRLRNIDHRNVLSFWYPFRPDLQGNEINLHAKLTICDDRFLRIGSTNISDRSMRLDTECDITADADSNSEHRNTIREFRHLCLAEHLSLPAQEVETFLQNNSLQDLIQGRVNHEQRCLRPIDDFLVPPEKDDLVMPEIYDPAEAIDLDKLSLELLPVKSPDKTKGRLISIISAVCLFFGLAFLWRWTPLNEYLSPVFLISQLEQLKELPVAPLLTTLALALAMSVMIPLTLLVIVSALAFGAVQGFIYAFIAAVMSFSFSFWLGHTLGTRTLHQFAGNRVLSISEALGRRGFLSSLAMRLIPVAPFTIVNLVAGASHIRFRDYIAGSALGQIPGILLLVIGVNRFKASLDDPRFSIISSSIAILTALILSIFYLAKKIRKKLEKKNAA